MAGRMFSGNFTRHIVHTLGRSIALGEYPPGQPLKAEADLCEEFDVSRTVLREAVKMLTAKGMLDARPRRGTLVQPESQWNLSDPEILSWLQDREISLPLMIEFADIRLAIEPVAAGLAARNVSDEMRQTLQNAMLRIEAAVRGEDDLLEAGIAFHVGVLGTSENRFFWNMRYTIEAALRFSFRVAHSVKGMKCVHVDNHQRILECILAGEPAAAEGEMRKLLLKARALLDKAQRDAHID